ncbi:MAG: protein kinase [Microcoleus sp. PH2017_10_PVI_O_A]|uniref:serine/threonine-protein kinase n=1 Tax=unclassified Microcoleus TaxID=2642155 RepID=UPI001E135ED7|nr:MULTISPECIES: serine/threonine-protein kinase [unclassified Microcoleus]TAE78207.1 MAG: serine/threonine protein kinase [Oscillatoriales cyanobacterium]MCC3408856.1 protein kinase [Microcoleus sp. PH2017_10_PVI_O_A]MCC3462989.1 protein kinase [Microcoleus sp. PH2017_11_PCY_U_A]MCC3481386.1 protein kinase [Microcoleus sp. PH2017_12_PCY_D_A]MCC3562403.1 protein kinase [Microcoleus sp. PH2017_27_LUM_O_A]
MSYCLNPACQNPQNADRTQFCLNCGTKLLLRERYRAIKPLGRGGFGRTFLAVDEDKPSKPRCAIKQFFPLSQGTSSAEKAAELFNREAVRLDELGKHPQIPELLAHFQQERYQYLVQEFIEGQNLQQELAGAGVFSENQIRSLLNDLLPVLEFVHSRNVIHRDIKPPNIIRRRVSQTPIIYTYPTLTGELVLVDFGAAKLVEGLRETGTVIGSPEFVAPEQIRGQAVYASDLYSLGVTCIYLLTQISPFDLFDINQDVWVWRDFLKVKVDRKLSRILDKMIEPSLSRRYKSVAEILQDLQPQHSPVQIPPTPVAAAIPAPQRMPAVQNAVPPTVAGTIIPVPPMQRVVPARAPTWRCVHTLVGHSLAVTSVAFSPDGATLASGSEDKTIEMWKLDAGKRWYTLTGHTDWVTCVAFSPDGATLASGGRDKTIQIWDLNKGKWWYALRGHEDRVYAVAFSPDGQVLATGSRDKTVQLWNLNKGRPMSALSGHAGGVEAVAFSPGGEFLASGSRDKSLQLWDWRNGRSICTLAEHGDWVRAIAFAATSSSISPPSQGGAGGGSILVSGSRDGTAKLWRIDADGRGTLLRSMRDNSGDVLCVALSPDGRVLATGSRDGSIYLWDAATGGLLELLTGHGGEVLSVAFGAGGGCLASGAGDRTVKIWRVGN